MESCSMRGATHSAAMGQDEPVQGARRQLKSRSSAWAVALAKAAGNAGLTPNTISVLIGLQILVFGI